MDTNYEVWVRMHKGGWERVLEADGDEYFTRARATEVAAKKADLDGVAEVNVVERRVVARLNGPPGRRE